MLFVVMWWFVSARKWFKGPVINIDHLMIGRDANVVKGVEHSSDSDSPSVPKKAEMEGTTLSQSEIH
jgi:hypothetical protein